MNNVLTFPTKKTATKLTRKRKVADNVVKIDRPQYRKIKAGIDIGEIKKGDYIFYIPGKWSFEKVLLITERDGTPQIGKIQITEKGMRFQILRGENIEFGESDFKNILGQVEGYQTKEFHDKQKQEVA